MHMTTHNKNQALKDARQRARLSQKRLSQAVGITQSQLSKMETGEAWASIEVIERVAKKLDIPISHLLGVDVQPGRLSQRTDKPAGILKQADSPAGLRDLASDKPMHKVLKINSDEWVFLSSLALPAPADKWGYISMLISMRAAISS